MQIDGKTEEIVRDFILGGSKITADDDCSHEIKGDLKEVLKGDLERKVMTHLAAYLEKEMATRSSTLA